MTLARLGFAAMAVVERGSRARASRSGERDKEYVLHSWSVQDAINPIPVAGAEGRYFWDYDGKRYLDFASQLVNVSTRPPAPEGRRGDQGAGRPALHDRAADGERASARELARLLAEVTPGDLTMSFFTNGGAEANENAIKLARWYTGRHKIDRALPLVPRRDGRRDHADRRPAPLARRARHPRRRADARPVHVPLPGRASRPVPGLHAAAPHLEEILQYEGAAHRRRRDPRDGHRDERASSSRPTATCSRSARSATGTASC